jgi:hypothetical protein
MEQGIHEARETAHRLRTHTHRLADEGIDREAYQAARIERLSAALTDALGVIREAEALFTPQACPNVGILTLLKFRVKALDTLAHYTRPGSPVRPRTRAACVAGPGGAVR